MVNGLSTNDSSCEVIGVSFLGVREIPHVAQREGPKHDSTPQKGQSLEGNHGKSLND